ncbi:hypothetical protein GCM10010236_10110 [Streptomyces eurythermus]|nr:hypothetical protein GCM10010236_10110 [Streptomyces eurythermus]
MMNSAFGPGIATMANAVTVNAGTLCSTATDAAGHVHPRLLAATAGPAARLRDGTEREATVKP